MAYRRTSTRRTSRTTTRRRAAPRRASTRRRAAPRRSSGQTVRIVLETRGDTLATDNLLTPREVAPRKAKF